MTTRKPDLSETPVIWRVGRASQCGRRTALRNEEMRVRFLDTTYQLGNEPTLVNESSGLNWRSPHCHLGRGSSGPAPVIALTERGRARVGVEVIPGSNWWETVKTRHV